MRERLGSFLSQHILSQDSTSCMCNCKAWHSITITLLQIDDGVSTGIGSERGAWFIPRPALCRDSTTCTCNSQASRSIQTVSEWLSPSNSSPSSKSSTQVCLYHKIYIYIYVHIVYNNIKYDLSFKYLH